MLRYYIPSKLIHWCTHRTQIRKLYIASIFEAFVFYLAYSKYMYMLGSNFRIGENSKKWPVFCCQNPKWSKKYKNFEFWTFLKPALGDNILGFLDSILPHSSGHSTKWNRTSTYICYITNISQCRTMTALWNSSPKKLLKIFLKKHDNIAYTPGR